MLAVEINTSEFVIQLNYDLALIKAGYYAGTVQAQAPEV